jgi:hypothetical protein
MDLLGEVDAFVGEGVVDVGHGVDGAAVEMEAGAGDVFGGGGVLQDGERIEGVVEVVVVEEDAGLDAGGVRKAGPRFSLMKTACSGESMSMLGVFFSLSGSFWMVRVSMGMPSAFMPSTYLVR